ncbi:MAG: class I SAM-dependent methyltransferase [Candidatus Obscuribacterales bacterium]|nr:class I SAM-dependent methyltransferase [Candidatus Obscuribacterales bacterium]
MTSQRNYSGQGIQFDKYKHWSYDRHKQLAEDSQLSVYEKIGIPESYRKGTEPEIFADVLSKLTNLDKREQTVLEIGPGCTDLPRVLAAYCDERASKVIFCDSLPMLSHIPDASNVEKVEGPFPACFESLESYKGKVDALLTYSMAQIVYSEGNLWLFLDRCLELLSHGGQFLIGDFPNQSKRRRFFSSPAGVEYHQNFTGKNEIPEITWNALEPGQIDDSVVMSILLRCRSQGFDSYLLPQHPSLAFANRREDILIVRP